MEVQLSHNRSQHDPPSPPNLISQRPSAHLYHLGFIAAIPQQLQCFLRDSLRLSIEPHETRPGVKHATADVSKGSSSFYRQRAAKHARRPQRSTCPSVNFFRACHRTIALCASHETLQDVSGNARPNLQHAQIQQWFGLVRDSLGNCRKGSSFWQPQSLSSVGVSLTCPQ